MPTVSLKARSFATLAALVLSLTGCNTTSHIAQRAANGDAGAQFEYGRRLLMGQRAPKDAARALVWFHAAASLGNPKAMAAIGYCHEKGLGTPVDAAKAREWYQRAADAGDADALFTLVGMDLKKGDQNQADAKLDLLSRRHRNRKATAMLIKRYMVQDSPQYNPAKGVDYLRFAAMDGSKDAARALSFCYANGIGVPQNPQLADGWKKWEP